MFRTNRKSFLEVFVSILFVATVVIAGRTGTRAGVGSQSSSLYESKPNVIDSGGGKSATSTCFTVTSIGQPMIGPASSAMYKSEAGFFTSEEGEPTVTGIVVTNTNDSGEGSLDWAVRQANIRAGADTIIFNIPDTDPGYDSETGVWTIKLPGGLPILSDYGTIVDGTTQSAFIGSDTNPYGPEIELDGSLSSGYIYCFYIRGSSNVIKELVINRFAFSGIQLENCDSCLIVGNYIGTDHTGTVPMGNGIDGIQTTGETMYNVIGGNEPGAGNIISANGRHGILLGSGCYNYRILNNKIGTDRLGESDLGNGEDGVIVGTGTIGADSHGNIIGPGNIIAFNEQYGVAVRGAGVVENTITENSITGNSEGGIRNLEGGNAYLEPPSITIVTTAAVTGTACADCIVEVFSDPDDQGMIYEGTTLADGSGNFTLNVEVTGPNVTATATDTAGNTSEFSEPAAFSPCLLGDVNCDGNITPGDALCAFWRAILGSFQEECECECSEQAAEINCDGNITPGDALCIFWRAILGDWTEDCQCLTAKMVMHGPSVDRLVIESEMGIPGQSVVIPIVVENPENLDAFCLELTYPENVLDFHDVSTTEVTEEWTALEGVPTGSGRVTVGGFHTDGIYSDTPVAIVQVTFAVRQDAFGNGEFDLVHLRDDVAGARVEKGNITLVELPTEFSLLQNYPNPFNPSTEIRYQISDSRLPAHTTLRVYNILGQEVRVVVDEAQKAGYHSATWDGRDSSGQQVPSGVYFYCLKAGDFTQTKKMVLMK